MPSKRFLSTAAPIGLLALAGMGLATAQSSSPFAAKKRAQAWEQVPQTPAVQAAAPQSWGVPGGQTPPSSAYKAPSSYQAPTSYQTPTSYQDPAPKYNPAPAYQPAPRPVVQPIPASADAPIATRPRSAPKLPKMESHSVNSPPKLSRAPAPKFQPYSPQALAGSNAPQRSAPPTGSHYNYTQPPTRVAQAPDFGSATPPSGQAVPQSAPTSGSPYAPQSGRRPQAWETQSAPPQPQAPTYQAPANPNQAPAQTYGAPSSTPPAAYGQPAYGQTGYTPNNYGQPGYPSSTPPTGAPYSSGPFGNGQQPKRSWTEKLGLKNIATLVRGKFIAGAAATDRDAPDNQLGPSDGWSDDQIGDAELELELSAITDGGLEYGVVLGARAQYDQYRRGFGGQLVECPPGVAGCSGTVSGLRGHTSGFYNGGEDITKDAQVALESAHLFLRSAYGDVTIGRDDGAAYLFSLGAPSLLAVGASNSSVDYTGYDSVKTVNDASGFAEKITYTSPRLLGDQIGFGVQVGASYALDGDVCGVDYCNGKNIDGILQADIEDIVEVGIAFDRTFENGLRAELTGTYASGSEQTGLDEFDDLESFGAGLEFEYGKWTLGGSYLNSNNALQDGDYTAYDVGLTWKPSALGFTLGYGYAEDDNVGLTSNQGTVGVTYDFKKFTLGTGVQYVDRDVNGVENGIPTTFDQRATSVFVQGGFKF